MPVGLVVEGIAESDEKITVIVRSAIQEKACPLYSRYSRRVHSRHVRTITDLPCAGKTVELHLFARRFFCGEAPDVWPRQARPPPGQTHRRSMIANIIGIASEPKKTPASVLLFGPSGAHPSVPAHIFDEPSRAAVEMAQEAGVPKRRMC